MPAAAAAAQSDGQLADKKMWFVQKMHKNACNFTLCIKLLPQQLFYINMAVEVDCIQQSCKSLGCRVQDEVCIVNQKEKESMPEANKDKNKNNSG